MIRKNRRRLTALFLLLVMLLTAAGCGAASSDTGATAQTEESTQTDAEESTEESTEEAQAANSAEEVVDEDLDAAMFVDPDGQNAAKDQEDGEGEASDAAETEEEAAVIDEDGSYTSKEEVALYLHTYGHLPGNFITKKEAESLGWDSSAGNLDEVAPGKSIGGSRFGNYEGLLPEADGRSYYECDIDYDGGYRGAKRLVYSSDGLIFYTEDHYQTFEQLY